MRFSVDLRPFQETESAWEIQEVEAQPQTGCPNIPPVFSQNGEE